MKKIGIIYPELKFAGPDAVAIWMLETLKLDYNVSLITVSEPNFRKLNKYFSTFLNVSDIKIRIINVPKLITNSHRVRLVKQHLLMKFCKKNKRHFDLFVSAYNEMDFGKIGIQYIHFPEIDAEEKIIINRWYYKNNIIRRIYKWISYRISAYSEKSMKNNISFANSEWTKRVFEKKYSSKCSVLYPPVLADFKVIKWQKKNNGIIFIGRISPDKRPTELLDIIRGVRNRGFNIHIHFIGPKGLDLRYFKNFLTQINKNSDWAFYEGKVPREKLKEIVSKHKYGISGKKFEHFGIAAAEMVKAGNIVFVNNEGGQVEIVGRNKYLIYNSDKDAINTIHNVLSNPKLQVELLKSLKQISKNYGVDIFCDKLKKTIKAYFQEK